jgi:hypothetical protein
VVGCRRTKISREKIFQAIIKEKELPLKGKKFPPANGGNTKKAKRKVETLRK